MFWALGLGEFVWLIVAVPMVYRLWVRPRRIRVPPFFGLWLALPGLGRSRRLHDRRAPARHLTTSGGYIGWGVRVADLLAATVVLLYVGNLGEDEMPARKVVRLLALFFSFTVVGGMLGTFFGSFSFTSPLEMVLPHGLRSNYYVHQLIHPGFAQVQDILGHDVAPPQGAVRLHQQLGQQHRPAADLVRGRGMDPRIAAGQGLDRLTLVVAAIPIIYSLNRGVWIGLGLSLLFWHFSWRPAAGRNCSGESLASSASLACSSR